MRKMARFMAKHIRFVTVVGMIALPVSWCVIGDAFSFPDWLTYTLAAIFVVYWILLVITASTYLLKEPLESLKNQCDPYPFLEEMDVQRTYPAKEAEKQIREINYAMALRCTGEYEKAFALLSSINIDKYAGMLPDIKVVYYNNLTDLCQLMGKHQEAVIWYEKTLQIWNDLKPGKQKEKLRNTVESTRAAMHFCKGEYDQALQVLGRAKIENLGDRIENAMMYARVYLALGDTEKAVRPLTFVAENGNKLYFATEAKELLAKINMEEQ